MKLGELFVDLGVNSGSALSSLGAFAFQLNNIADLAKKVNTSVGNLFGGREYGSYTRNLSDLSTRLTLPIKKLQGMERAAKMVGGDFSVMTSRMKEFVREKAQAFSTGEVEGFLKKYSRFGMTLSDEKTSPIEAMQKMIGTINRINSEELRQGFLETMGFSVREYESFQEYLNNMSKYDNDRMNLTQAEIEAGNNLNNSLNSLSVTTDDTANLLKANFAGSVNHAATELDELGKRLNNFLRSEKGQKIAESFNNEFINIIDSLAHPFDTLAKAFTGLYEELGGREFNDLSLGKKFAISGGSVLAGTGALTPHLLVNAVSDAVTTGVLYSYDKIKDKTKHLYEAYSKSPNFVNMRDLGLHGSVWEKNTLPFVPVSGIKKIKEFDEKMHELGYDVVYTSNLGGKHEVGSGHYYGRKFDAQIFKNGKLLSGAELNAVTGLLKDMGYIGNGAVGYEKQDNGKWHMDLLNSDVAPIVQPLEDKNISNKNTNITNTINVSSVPDKLVPDTIRAINNTISQSYNLA